MHRTQHAFHLLELSVALSLIAVLAIVSVPVFTKASDRARAEACFGNLEQIGRQLERELQNHGRFPTLADQPQTQGTEQCLRTFLGEDAARFTRCPGDEALAENARATSYRWFEAWNGMSDQGQNAVASLPLLIERDNFHNLEENSRAALLLFRDSPTESRLNARWVHGKTYAPTSLGN